MTKYLLAITLTIFSMTFAVAQMPMMGGGGGAGAPKQANIGHIYGKVVDSLGKPMEFASVILLVTKLDSATKKYKDVLLKGQVTEGNGDFDFTELPLFGKLKLKITSIGYKDIEMPIVFQMNMGAMGGQRPPQSGQSGQGGGMPDGGSISKMMSGIDRDLGNIKMFSDAKLLEGVTVTATKALFEMNIDKKIFNVEKNIVSTGGTAVDVMRNVPSVQVDIDGNVKVRNAAPQIFVDGRPTTLSLDQIPADAIEKVEVMTNPSAKYDASGSNAGILNLVLKKNKKSGYNGMINLGADRFGGGNVMGNFNLRQNKFNFSAIVTSNQMRSNTTGNSDRESVINGIKATTLQDISGKTNGSFSFGRVGMDYFATNRTTLSLAGIMVRGQFKPTEDIGITTKTDAYSGFSNRLSNSDRLFRAKGFQAGIKHNFPKAGEEWTMDMNYFGGKNEGSGLFTTNYYTPNNTIFGSQVQKNIGNGSNSFMVVQTDYVRPLGAKGDKGNLEMGLKAQINSIKSENDNSLKPLGATDFKSIAAAALNYENQNDVYAAYTSLSGKTKLLSYKVGLRAESSKYTGKLLNTNQSFGNEFPISLFPSVFVTKELKKGEQVQLNVTRRVNRPNFFQQIPFIDFTDSLNITRGNANLVPEFTYSSEASYSKSKGSHTFLATVYYKYTDNLITRFLSQEVNPVSGRTDFINTYINANSSQVYGLELTYTTQIKKWWEIMANVNFYNAKISTKNIEQDVSDALWTNFSKVNNTFKLPKKWTIQLSGDYQGKTNIPITQNQGFGPPMSQAQSASQGYVKPYGGVDIAFKKTFAKNDVASASLSFNDIFKTRGNGQFATGTGFQQNFYRITNPQMVRLNLSYRFGKMDLSLFKKQNMKGQAEGMQNGMQMGN